MSDIQKNIQNVVAQIMEAGLQSHRAAQIAGENTSLLKGRKSRGVIPEPVADLIRRVEQLQKSIPERFHECIGCPCSEFDYPSCKECPHLNDCLEGNIAYPPGCTAGMCMEYQRWRNPYMMGWGS